MHYGESPVKASHVWFTYITSSYTTHAEYKGIRNSHITLMTKNLFDKQRDILQLHWEQETCCNKIVSNCNKFVKFILFCNKRTCDKNIQIFAVKQQQNTKHI